MQEYTRCVPEVHPRKRMEPEMLMLGKDEIETLIVVEMYATSDRIWARVDQCSRKSCRSCFSRR